MAKRDLKSVIYTDDLGNQWATKIDASIFAQTGASTAVKVGGADYTGSPRLPALPRGFRPRVALVSEATHGKRRVVCLTPDSELYQGVENSINLQVLGAASATFTAYGTTGEKRLINHDPNQ